MNKLTYSDKLKDPRWQKKRLEILNRDDWKCTLCNDTSSTLSVHHKKYTGEPWDAPNDALITVCEHCHSLLSSKSFAQFDRELNRVYKRIRKDKGFIFFAVESQSNDLFMWIYYIESKEFDYCIALSAEVFNDLIDFYKS